MNGVEVIDLIREALIVLLKISAPVMIVALVVGLAIALFQALTQIQEMTLTFVPKILAIFICIIITLPYMLEVMFNFTEEISDRIITIEKRDSE